MPIVKHGAAAPNQERVRALEDVRTEIEHADPARRRAAARALAGAPDSSIVLLQALAAETEREVQSALLGALAEDACPSAIAGLAECLRSEDAWLRNAAIELLRSLPERSAPVVAPVIEFLLADDDRDVRILATGILDALDPARAQDWLLELLEREQDVNVCAAALEVLAQVGTIAAAAPVARLAERFAGEPFIAFACALVNRRIGAAA
jgi:HEAT repeat protein